MGYINMMVDNIVKNIMDKDIALRLVHLIPCRSTNANTFYWDQPEGRHVIGQDYYEFFPAHEQLDYESVAQWT